MMFNFIKVLALSAGIAIVALPAMAACDPGQTPTGHPACETGHLEFVMADAISTCLTVRFIETGHLWAVFTEPNVPTGPESAQVLRDGLIVRLANPAAPASLLGSGDPVWECGPNVMRIGQVK